MSLHAIADHMASKGRGPDSVLIHMSPSEVQGLQALAMSHGGSLTINPETGLPEAGFLDKLLPTIIGAGLTFFGGVPPHIAAMMVGGVETVRTGDIGKGISAGLGAYGGANLTAGLTEAGASTIGAAEAAKGLTMPPELLAEFGGEGAKDALLQQQVADRMAAATPYEKLSSGFDAFGKNPMGMAKSLATPAAMAFGPAILAGANVKANMPQTVTKPGQIRPYAFDPYGGTYTAGTPYEAAPTRAAEGGLMGMNDGGYSPGQLEFAQHSEPVLRMAGGGSVAHFAAGGDAALEAYQSGNFAEASRLLAEAGMSAQDVVSKYGLSQEAAAGVAKNLGYAGDMSGIQYAAAAPVAPAAVSAPTYAPSYTPNRAAIEPEDTAVAPTGGLDSLAASQVQAPIAQTPTPQTANIAAIQGTPEDLTSADKDTFYAAVTVYDPVTGRQFSSPQQAIAAGVTNYAMGQPPVTTGTTGGLDTLAADQTAKADANAAAKLGVFQTVYDPKTGRSFVSPAQALQSGVTDYVAEMPFNREFMQKVDATAKNTIDSMMAQGKTFEQALDVIGGQFGMTGKEFYNSEVQGGINYADHQKVRDAVATQSGGLTPEQLTAKLQAFKDKPPTTAQEFADQRALYADYQRRYGDSSWNYANMGGKAQDYSLKPKDYLATKFTGYAEPINFALSNMKQNSTEFKEMSKILTANPEINDVINQLYKINPEAPIFNAVNPKYAGGTEESSMASNFNVSLKNLAGSIKQDGADAAMRQFVGQQMNLVSFKPDAQGNVGNPNQKSMSNPEYRALNAIKDSYTPIADNAAWNKQSSLGAPRGSTFSEPYRDSTTGKGLSLVYDKTGNITGVNFIDQSGMGQIVYNDPTKLIEAAYESGIPLSAFNEIAKKAGSDVLIPSQKGMRGGDYFPEGLKDGVKFSDIANGNLAKTVASPEWLNFMTKDAIDKETNLGNPDYAGGLNDKIAKLKNQNQIAKDYLADIGGGSTASADTAAKTQGAPAGLEALASNQTATTQGAPAGLEALAAAPPSATRRVNTDTPYVYNPEWQAELEKAVREDNQPKINALLAEQDAEQRGVAQPPAAQPPAAQPPAGGYTQFTNEQIGKYLKDNPTADLAKAIKDTNADPAAVNKYIASLTTPFKGSTTDERGSGTFGIYNQMKEQGIDPSEYFAAATANDPKYAGWTKAMIQEAYDLNKGMYALSEAKQGKVTDTDWAKLMVGKGTWDKPQYDPNEMAQATGLSIREVQSRYDLEKLKAKAATPVTPVKPVTPPPTQVITKGDGTTVTRVTEPTPIITAPEVVLPPGVSGATGPSIVGGGTTVNPNGTITTSPRIPNIPAGGFTGMKSLRDAYTQGGGSLGYIPYAPKTIEEFNAKYNTMTGGSKQEYDYLMGNAAYSPVPYTPTGEIMKPYFESVGRAPVNLKTKKYIYDTETRTYKENPAYVKPSYVLAGEKAAADKETTKADAASGKSIYVTDNQGNSEPAYLRGDGFYYTSGGTKYDVTGKQIVAGGGLMALADGGITGSGQLNLNIPLNLGGGNGYNGYGAMGGGFGSMPSNFANNQNSVQQSGLPEFRNQMQGFESQIQKLPSVMAYSDYGKSLRLTGAGGGNDRPLTPDEQAKMQELQKAVQGDKGFLDLQSQMRGVESKYQQQAMRNQSSGLQQRYMQQAPNAQGYAAGGMSSQYDLGGYSDGGRLLRGPGDGVSDSIPATIGNKRPARLADGEFVVPARIVSELGNGSTEAGARKLYAMMDRVQAARRGSIGKGKVAKNSRADKYLPA